MNRIRAASLATLILAADPAAAQEQPWDVREMAAFIDGVMQAQSEAHHFAGAVVTVVHNGDILFSKGYGYADFSERKPVDPTRTLFRVASNSKMFVWTAVMQLVEEGKLDLHTDVNRYLEAVEIPATFPEPITLEHLMTHTAGFEDKISGLFRHDAESMRPLAELMKRDMPRRVFPPGSVTAYSNYGTALAALVVESVSGVPFGDYIEQRILDPLGMQHAAIAQPLPARLAADVSKGYQWASGTFREEPFEFMPWAPAGGMSVSGEDMGRFMIAHLNDGVLGGNRILRAETAREMRQKLTSISPKINGMLHGFIELNWGDEPAYGHTGDTVWFHSETLMLPARNLGVFVAYNTASGSAARDQFHSAFLEHYFPAPLPKEPAPPQVSPTELARFTGVYSIARASQSDPSSIVRLVTTTTVSVDPDGYLRTAQPGQTARWRQVEPLVFDEVDGHGRLVFRENERGEIVDLGTSPMGTVVFQKQPAWNTLRVQLPVLIVSIATLLAALIGYPIAAARRRNRAALFAAKAVRLGAWLTSAAFVLGLIFFVAGLGSNPSLLVFGVPPAVRAAETLWIAGVVLTVAVAAGTLWSWRQRWWNAAARTRLTLVCLAAIALAVWLNHWNMLAD